MEAFDAPCGWVPHRYPARDPSEVSDTAHSGAVDWSNLAGVDDLRDKVEDYIILPRRHKGLAKSMTAITREK